MTEVSHESTTLTPTTPRAARVTGRGRAFQSLLALLRQALLALPLLWAVVSVVFLLIHLVPGDPIVQMLGEGASATDIAALRHNFGLDLPLGTQYAHYWAGVLHGNLGSSLRLRRSVLALVLERYPYTVALALAALALGVSLSVPAGTASAVRRGRTTDRLVGILSLSGLSFPNFALGPMLILVFSIGLGWLPVSGAGSAGDPPGTFLLHLILPAVTLGLSLAAILTRMIRSALLEELGQDYIRTARAKGLSEARVLLRHALPNAMLPILTIFGLQFGSLLAGAIVTETIFSWPGLGRLTLSAINNRDYALVQGCLLAIGLSYVLVNLLTDLAYVLIDPRLRTRR